MAVWKRIKNSAAWLEWLCKNICRKAGLVAEKPAWLAGKTVSLVDASEVVLHGNDKKYYLLHYSLDLFTLSMREMHITDMTIGEKLRNFKQIGPGDIMMGEREHTRDGICAGVRGGLCTAVAGRGVYPV
ncbi:hypothetical protein AGMMS4952_23180 [Spirochaetia bacterium]|nr:hypothetical protein AGMMS4952_23180 [Spirochaetia bacterium]